MYPVLSDVWKLMYKVKKSVPSKIGHHYLPDDTFAYIATQWITNDRITANFNGRVIEVSARQGDIVNKSDVPAYIERDSV